MRRLLTLAVFWALAVAALADGPELDARGWKPGPTCSNGAWEEGSRLTACMYPAGPQEQL